MQSTLGWTTPAIRMPGQADRWTWLVIAAYTELRLARSLVSDLRLRAEQLAWPAGTALEHTLTSVSPLAPWRPLGLTPAAAAGRATSVAKNSDPASTPTIARRFVRMDAPSTSATTPMASRGYQRHTVRPWPARHIFGHAPAW